MQLKTLTIEGQKPGQHLLILAGVHGDEFEPMAAVRKLAKVLLPKELKGRITLVPVVNEEAFMNGARCANDGLDLARTCPGKVDGSYTEQVAFAVSELIKTADYLIDLHTGGNVMSLFPLTGYALHPDAKVLSVQRRMTKAFNLPLVWGSDPNLEGRTLSVARDHNIPAIYAEWMGGGGCQSQGVQDYVEGCLNVMGELGMIERKAAESKIEKIVEEDFAGAGLLTGNYLSPHDGLFESAVELWDDVDEGSLIGSVSDVLGQYVTQIKSTQTGKIICLRVFARVLQGDSLCHILNING
ncbi:MAG: M14 family metallopeptidase [Abditibacteriaceae bacterium]